MELRKIHRIVPPGTVRIADKRSDAVVYIYDRGGKPYAQVFYGKQSKPVLNCWFKNEADREKTVAEYFQRRQLWDTAKQTDRAARAAQTPDYKVGDILVSSWGYDMTLVDFYQVTAVSGKRVTIRQIHSEVVVPDGGGAGRVTALPGQFKGEPMVKLGQPGGVKVEHRRHARKWDGAPQYYNTYD